MTDQERELRKALSGLLDMARVNFPRSTDLTVALSSSGPANGSVTIPAWLLSKLLAQKDQDNG